MSAGFQVKPGGLRWQGRSRYTVGRATLRHIALVSDGAYGEHAGILDVRAGRSTLRLDAALASL